MPHADFDKNNAVQPPRANPPIPPPPQKIGPRRALNSLQSKTTVMVVTLVVTVAVLVSGYLFRASVELLSAQHNEELTQMGAVLAQAAATPIAEGDSATLTAIARELVNGAPVLYILFTGVSGADLGGAYHGESKELRRRAHVEQVRPIVAGHPQFVSDADGLPGYLDITYPVSRRADETTSWSGDPAHLVGYVRTGIVATGWRQMLASKLDLLIGLGVIAVALAIPLGFLVVRRITRPLGELETAMDRFSRGDLSVRSRTVRDDEIGRLAHAFNHMADLHQQSHERIVKLNTELEGRVAQRTRQLRELSIREPLTGLYNRRYFGEMAERCFAESRRYDHDLTCLMMDLDDFKGVNDRFGHYVGDDVLVLLAGIISSQLRSSDIPARYGGDEFIIFLPQTGPKRAEVLAERITERFNVEVLERMPQLHTGMSLGIASLLTVAAKDASDLIRAADRALYHAKRSGKSRIIVAGAPPQSSIA